MRLVILEAESLGKDMDLSLIHILLAAITGQTYNACFDPQ